jgi:hypothetical protein
MSGTAIPATTVTSRPLVLPWRDPHTLPGADLLAAIERLERACVENPRSPDLRVCLGMAYAMHLDVYKSMDALEAAVGLAPDHFLAQFKLAELLYRLRALYRAEQETTKALNLATNPWEVAMARRQLQEIRRLIREGTQKPAWTKSLAAPLLTLAALIAAAALAVTQWP